MGFWLTNGSPNLGQITRPHNNQQKKRTCKIVAFAVPADHRVKLKGNEKKDKYLDLARELKKNVEHESDVYTNSNWCSWYSDRKIIKGSGGLGNKKTTGDLHNNYIIDNDQNTKKSPGDLRKLVVNQTS